MKVGDPIFVVRSSHYGGDRTFESTVTTVGRKYFTIEGARQAKFYIEGWAEVTEYRSMYTLYPSREAYEEKVKRDRLWDAIRDYVSSSYGIVPKGTTTEQLESVVEALGLSKVKQ